MSIQLIDLEKKYGNQKALDAVSFELKKGEIVGLLGPNGAGKSTLIKCICGLLKPDNGTILIKGKSNQKGYKWKKFIGYLAENNPLYEDMYVKEYLSFVSDINQKGDLDQLIEQVGLKSEAHKKIGNLSKGYKQRVGLAQALIHEPDVIVLDEPTNGLDPNQLIGIRQLIKSLGKEKTVLLSTHLMQEVDALCDRVIILDKGIIKEDLSISDFKKQYDSLEKAFFALTH